MPLLQSEGRTVEVETVTINCGTKKRKTSLTSSHIGPTGATLSAAEKVSLL